VKKAMKKKTVIAVALLAIAIVVGVNSPVDATVMTQIYILDKPALTSPVQILSGLSAKAIFTYDTTLPNILQIELFNTSTDVPAGFSNSDQLLTGISFDFGHPGYNGDPKILSGTVIIGHAGRSINFDKINPQLGSGNNVTGEWGYGNEDGTGLLTNFVTAEKARATAFGGANLDGPENIDGPQAGLCADSPLVVLDGLGAVADSVTITLTLDSSPGNLNFLTQNGVMAEYGSDAAFLIPEPATIIMFSLGSLIVMRRRKR